MKKIIDAHMHLPYCIEGLQNKKEHPLMQLENFDLSAIEKEMVFYNNAKRIYRLEAMEDL